MPSTIAPRLTNTSARATGSSQRGVAASMCWWMPAPAGAAASPTGTCGRSWLTARLQQFLRGGQQRLGGLVLVRVVLPRRGLGDGLPLGERRGVDVVGLGAGLGVDLGDELVVGARGLHR